MADDADREGHDRDIGYDSDSEAMITAILTMVDPAPFFQHQSTTCTAKPQAQK